MSKMDPEALRPAEVDYELHIRRIEGIPTNHRKVLTLKELLRKEKLGVEKQPGTYGDLCNASNELQACRNIIQSVWDSIPDSRQVTCTRLRNEILSRQQHVKDRISRIVPSTAKEGSDLSDVNKRYNQLSKFIDGLRQSSWKSVGRNTSVQQTAVEIRRSMASTVAADDQATGAAGGIEVSEEAELQQSNVRQTTPEIFGAQFNINSSLF